MKDRVGWGGNVRFFFKEGRKARGSHKKWTTFPQAQSKEVLGGFKKKKKKGGPGENSKPKNWVQKEKFASGAKKKASTRT